MKRILSIVLLMLLVLSGCNRSITTADILGDTPIFSMPTVSVYQKNAQYYIAIKDKKGEETVRAVFLPTRVADKTYNLDLIENADCETFLGLSLTEIEEKYGAFHTDVGSGFFSPAYITEDGYLVVFGLDGDDCVRLVTQCDLIEGSVAETVAKTNQGQ